MAIFYVSSPRPPPTHADGSLFFAISTDEVTGSLFAGFIGLQISRDLLGHFYYALQSSNTYVFCRICRILYCMFGPMNGLRYLGFVLYTDTFGVHIFNVNL